ncbi:MAG TPA: hypothetical protein VGD88_05635, partial [Opitutaceae bacterium]
VARDDIAVRGGHREPSLVVHCDGGLTLKHNPCPSICRWTVIEPRKTTKTPVFPLLPTLAPRTGLSTGNRRRNRLADQWFAANFRDLFKPYPQVAV